MGQVTSEGRKYVAASLDRTGAIAEQDAAAIFASGQHTPYLYAPDRWGDFRFNHGVNFLLSWAEPHVANYRYGYRDDDYCVDVFPETESPWQFPSHVFLVSGHQTKPEMEGFMIEPAYLEPDPTRPPSGALYKIDERALPEYGIRVGASGGFLARSVSWGPEHNLDAGRTLMLAPLAWQGSRTNKIGEQWELQGQPTWDFKKHKQTSNGYDTTGVSGVFPVDPLMPHGDPEPLWNDGLDAERLARGGKNRRDGMPYRGSSDKFIALWGDLVQTQFTDTSLVDGQLAVSRNSEAYKADAAEALLGRYDWGDKRQQPRWVDPAHYGQVNEQNFPRQMARCLLCFDAAKCRATNNPARGASEGCVGTLGFRRNHYADVPAALNPSGALGSLYAASRCMYSTNNPFEKNFPAEQLDGETLQDFLKRYNNTSDLCHVNGMPRRAVEYDGHYRLLLKEIYRPLFASHLERLFQIHSGTQNPAELAWGKHTLLISRHEQPDYEGNTLYRAVYKGVYPEELELGQYARQLAGKDSPVLFWFSVRFDHATAQFVLTRVWAYIWYVSAHSDKTQRTLVKRLVELKHDYGFFYGNVTEGRTEAPFSGGSSQLEPLPIDRWLDEQGDAAGEVWRPAWVKQNGKWIKKDKGVNLVGYWGSYRIDENARAQGELTIYAQPGEIIPTTFLAYSEPKMITWGKSKTDPNTQKSLGKTRWHFDWRKGKWTREVGDIDDLYYHLRYDDPRAEGALSSYMEDLGPGTGWWSHFMNPSGDASHPVNVTELQVRIADPLLTPSDVAGKADFELNDLRDTDLVLKSDFQHARNFTAPIFAFDLTSQTPLHHVVKPDLPLSHTDWCTRQEEPFDVMAQREYAATPPVWTFAKNSTDRESWYPRMVEYEDGTKERVQVWMPEGRVWWHRKGLLGSMREWTPGASEAFTMTGVTVVNLWRKYLPHHMQVVRAYLWLEPVTDHYETEDYHGTKFQPFASLKTLVGDTSSKKTEIEWCARRYALFPDTPGKHWSQYPIPIEDQWEEIKEAGHKLLGKWELGGCQSPRWDDPGVSTQGWTEWDLNHQFDHASFQHQFHIARGCRLSVNGLPANSMDKDNPDQLAQRNLDWYNALGELYQDGGFATIDERGVVEDRVYHRNLNSYFGLNTNRDCGEMESGIPDQTGKAYGYTTSGGGRKAPFIFNVTNQVRAAYGDRMDAEFRTVVDPYSLQRQHTSAHATGNYPTQNVLVALSCVGAAGEAVLDGTDPANKATLLATGLESGENFVLYDIKLAPPSVYTEDYFLRLSYRVKDSRIWRTLYEWRADSQTPFDGVGVSRSLQNKPIIACELRFEAGDAGGIALVDVEYIGDIGRVPVTGPAEVEQFTPATSQQIGGVNSLWTMPLKETPCKIYRVQVSAGGKTRELKYGGEKPRWAFFIEPGSDQAKNPQDYYWYDPIDNVLTIVKSSRLVSYIEVYEDFICDVEYVSRAGATALVAVEASVAGPTHDVDPEAICMLHEEDLKRLPQDPDIPWAVLNPEEMQGGYQYWEPEYKDMIAEESLAKNPDLPDPAADPEYAGRGINFVKLGSMPDSFSKDEANYRKFWIQEGSAGAPVLVDGAWKTRARGWVKFYGPPNTVIPQGIRVIAPAYVKYRDPQTQQELTPNSPQAGGFAPRVPNGAMKPAPLVLELKMEDSDHPSDVFARKTAAFRPHLLVYLRENTTFLGATHWKETGEGYGESSEVTGTPYWE